MPHAPPSPAASARITTAQPGHFVLSGCWTALAMGNLPRQLAALHAGPDGTIVLDGAQLDTIDSAGVWLLQRRLDTLGAQVRLQAWPERCQKLMAAVGALEIGTPPATPRHNALERIGSSAATAAQEGFALFSFIGDISLTIAHLCLHPGRWRWRATLSNLQIAGFDALPITGLTAALLGIVVAYQGADQLRHYGANIFVVELIGYAMLREFAPLITAIIIAGRSGSAYAAQIGTMRVTEELDAMRTIGIAPLEMLVLPKVFALLLALPLLTMFADLTGVVGGMLMARTQLDIGYHAFLHRFGTEIPLSALLLGIGKSMVFALVITTIGCFQGFRTKANADSVGRQTTRSVVQSIFFVIVADAIFSVIFSVLDL
jgi:phospholipid/cholesterol/gamma-HCH transport system permease protein